LSDAAADLHAADPHPAASGYRRATHHCRTAISGAAGPVDAAGADHSIHVEPASKQIFSHVEKMIIGTL
jgi:hypothetical protein